MGYKSKYEYSEKFKEAYLIDNHPRAIADYLGWSYCGAVQRAIARIASEQGFHLRKMNKSSLEPQDFPESFLKELAADCKSLDDLAYRLYYLVPDKKLRAYVKDHELKLDSGRYHYSEDFLLAVKTSKTKREVFRKLGWPLSDTSSYKRFDEYLAQSNLNIDHFKTDWAGGKRLSDEEFFIHGTARHGASIKDRLYEQGVKKECSLCGLSEWMGGAIALEIDHIDGNRLNNQITNLRILCPNCHSQTETHAGKNKGKYKST